MDKERRRQLMEEYKNRRPEMGVISFCCTATGESFLGTSADTRADFNSVRCKLAANWHPNKRLLELWNQHGESGFKISVLRILKYEDPLADYTRKLEVLLEQCLEEDSKAVRIWR